MLDCLYPVSIEFVLYLKEYILHKIISEKKVFRFEVHLNGGSLLLLENLGKFLWGYQSKRYKQIGFELKNRIFSLNVTKVIYENNSFEVR